MASAVMGYVGYNGMMGPTQRGGKTGPFPAPSWNMPMMMPMPYGQGPMGQPGLPMYQHMYPPAMHQPRQQPQHQPQRQPQLQQHQMSAYRNLNTRPPPSKATLKITYETIIRAPPPHPAKALPKPIPMYLRENRTPSFKVNVKMPENRVPVTIELDNGDDIRDVKAVIERVTGTPGAEIRLFHGIRELKDNTENVGKAGLQEGTNLEVQTFNAREGWGIAAVPEDILVLDEFVELTGKSEEELAEWKELKPGEVKVLYGYNDRTDPSRKAKILMDIYETVMSRPPPGCHPDPRADIPCLFWAKGEDCKAGPSCPYSHAGKKGGGGFFFQRMDPRSKVTCTFYTQGKCLRGQMCPFSHPKPAAPAQGQPGFSPPGFKGMMPPQ